MEFKDRLREARDLEVEIDKARFTFQTTPDQAKRMEAFELMKNLIAQRTPETVQEMERRINEV